MFFKNISSRKGKHIVHGVYFSPMIWVGKNPINQKKNYEVNIIENDFTVAFETSYNGYDLFITETGLILFFCDDRKKTHELLNLLFGMIYVLIRNIDVRVVREQDITFMEIDFDKKMILSMSKPRGDATSDWLSERNDKINWLDFKNRKIIVYNKSLLKGIIEGFDKMPKDHFRLVHLLLDAYTQYQDGNYTASYILGWIVVEGIISKTWENFLKTNFNTKQVKDQKKMVKDPNWTVSIKIKSLQITNQLTHDLANLLLKFNSLRNDIIHKWLIKDKEISRTKTQAMVKITRYLSSKYIFELKASDELRIEDDKIFSRLLQSWNRESEEDMEEILGSWKEGILDVVLENGS